MKPSLQPPELLEMLLEGSPPSGADLKALARDFPREGQWHEWKGGKLAGESLCNQKIRKALASFSNAEGGMLVLGYDEASQAFDGFTVPGGRIAADWIRDLLSPIPTIPQPRTFPVRVDNVEVIVVAIPRGETLVSVVESQVQKHFLRSGDGTLNPPPYLILDLTLGRRRQPTLSLDLHVEIGTRRTESQIAFLTNHARFHRVNLEFTVRNDSLLHVDQIQLGLVTYQLGSASQIAGSLREAVDDRSAPHNFDPFWRGGNLAMSRYAMDLAALAPFESRSASFEPTIPFLFQLEKWAPNFGMDIQAVRSEVRAGLLQFDAAVYVLARGVAPQWHQLEMTTQFVQEPASISATARRLIRVRPRVGVRFAGTGT